MLETTSFAILLGLSVLGASACHSSRAAGEDKNTDSASAGAGNAGAGNAGPGSDEFVSVDVGFSFERSCSTSPAAAMFPTTGVSCTILGDAARVRVNLTTSGDSPLLAVSFDGLEPGLKNTADATTTDVVLQGKCPARARGSSEQCTVELVSLKRAATPAPAGAVEPGSALDLRVSCPSTLDNNQGDAVSSTRQVPQRFDISAKDCVVY